MSDFATTENVAMWLTTMQLQSEWYQRAYDLLHARGSQTGFYIIFQPTPVLTAEQVMGWGSVVGVRVRRVVSGPLPPDTIVLSLK